MDGTQRESRAPRWGRMAGGIAGAVATGAVAAAAGLAATPAAGRGQTTGTTPGGGGDTWAAAEARVRRVAPAEVAALPATVRRALEASGCRIPQPGPVPVPVPVSGARGSATPAARRGAQTNAASDAAEAAAQNAVRGQFLAAGRFAWAVLCSGAGPAAGTWRSRVVVVDEAGGAAEMVAEASERDFLTEDGEEGSGRFTYRRRLVVTPAARLASQAWAAEAARDGARGRDGISDVIDDAAAQVHVRTRRGWTTLDPGGGT